ncbi:MAG: ribonuclease G [Dehalococcoidia bacterium]|nr:ribonuclease G [Dehalococcoidia bacterium]MDD5647467.1 ribonuclease G [Dehalococcoidia bacterium]
MTETIIDAKGAAAPAATGRWNWGAFLTTWIWGLGNGTYIALLALLPVVNIIMAVILGIKGGQWAWKNRRWENIEQFTRVQGLWTAFGFGLLAGCVLVLAIVITLLIVTFNNVFM